MRAIAVSLHRYVGLAVGGFLAVAGLTGSVLAFEGELDAWLNPGLFHAEVTPRPMLTPSHLAAQVERADPRVQIFAIALGSGPGDSTSVYVRPRQATVKPPAYNQVFVDPTTGNMLGRRMDGAVRFDRAHLIPFIHRFHYTLHMPGIWGVWLMGGVALAWMLDCFVGFYLTLPRGKPFWKKWRPIWTVKRTAGPYRFNLDLHRASGLWLWPVMFLMALSGVSLNLNSEVFRPVLSALLPTSPNILAQPIPTTEPVMTLDWDAAVFRARAEADRRGWNGPVSVIYAVRELGFFIVRFGREHEPGFGVSTVYISGTDGHVLSVEEAGRGKAGDVVAGLMFPIHSGQVAGLPGRILICITGLVVTMLSITGVYIWWKKLVPRVVRKMANRARRKAAIPLSQIDVAK